MQQGADHLGELLKEVEPEDLIKYGLIPEFVGRFPVIVTFDERGQILSVRLRKSSGHKVLDEDAISTVKNLRSLPKPPGELGWTRKSLTIPIRYKRS